MINRVLIVGLGSIGKRHLQISRDLLPEAEICILRHQKSNSIPEFADKCFSTMDQAIKFAPQIAVIANPAPFHLHTALQLTSIGTNLLIEKPIAASLDGIEQLLNSCREIGTVLMTGYNLRFLPSLSKFRELLASNLIGRVNSVRCEFGQYLPSWRPDTDYRLGVSAQSELGGGVLLELSHEIDYLRWIFGEVNWVKASLLRQSSLEVDVEDTAHLVLGFKPKNDGHALVGTLNIDFVRHDTTRLCTAIGEDGSLRWNGLTGLIEQYKMGVNEWTEIFCYQHKRNESYVSEWNHFLNCVNNQVAPLITGEDGLKVLEIIDAARLASEFGKVVQVGKLQLKKKVSV